MTEAQIELQNALTTTFLANLVFLSEYDKELYLKVNELSKMIENGTYKEKYALEFIMKSGDFDIYDIVNDKYLYNKKPKKVNDDLVRKVQFDEKYSIFDLPEYFLFREQTKLDLDKFNHEKGSDSILTTKNKMWEYSNVLNDFLDKKKRKLKKIKKFVFLGTLLGRHIPRIAEKIDAEMYLVLERNLEIFRLSLFTVDYTILANKGVIFSIMDNSLIEENKILKFINLENLENYLIKISSTGFNIDRYIDILLSSLHSVRPTAYDYIRMLYIHVNRTTKILSNDYKILHLNKINKNKEIFKDIPILYLAAGPSLDENLDWIKRNQDKFFIVTIGAAYKKLLSNDIKIDLISTIDESDILEKLQFDDESVSKINKKTIILASVMTNEKILKKFNQEKLFLFEIFTPFEINNIVYDGYSVGEITLAILMNMNPKKIYLIGLDLALNQITGESHSKASNSIIQVIDLNKEESRETFSLDESLIKVKGNMKEEVFTTSLFYSSIKSTEIKIAKKEDNLEIYNLSSHGSYFEGTIPKKINDLNIKEFTKLKLKRDEYISFLTENSFKELSLESKEYFSKQIDFLRNDIKSILMELKNDKIEFYEEFYEKVFLIPSKISQNNAPILFQIFANYYQMVIPFLSYHFNNLRVKNEKNKVKKIKEIFTKQIEEIIDDYIKCLQRVI
ncbi:6-hydroxymethylpterin diphosphokinase MptE-like protein [Arcobacter ellisii]|uniref:Motility accessory factor n=1 Tax=Arcobacter ellisii TaxID=913109 RepID=A0A347UBP8_9BACT|nr:6-hydroxymethylpterin diphosphokinase MptE-like protein [Arcobacter ellisii]AXX96276.1 motility accessory factor [Arcobacter ellisii]RXI31881.1 hypothetical protein CP962_03615 [Arcobacter ellisii]